MMPEPSQNGWNEYARHILAELKRHSKGIEANTKLLNGINSRLTVLEVKAGMWGVLGGSVAGTVVGFVVMKMIGP